MCAKRVILRGFGQEKRGQKGVFGATKAGKKAFFACGRGDCWAQRGFQAQIGHYVRMRSRPKTTLGVGWKGENSATRRRRLCWPASNPDNTGFQSTGEEGLLRPKRRSHWCARAVASMAFRETVGKRALSFSSSRWAHTYSVDKIINPIKMKRIPWRIGRKRPIIPSNTKNQPRANTASRFSKGRICHQLGIVGSCRGDPTTPPDRAGS